jgi:hypothetical protein
VEDVQESENEVSGWLLKKKRKRMQGIHALKQTDNIV